jgi:phosphoribosylformylglycinamidine synthase subunit PurQ / glutaminase
VMRAVERFALNGGYVLGICNGFQILLEAGLLPGAMLRNRSLKFSCKDVFVRVEESTGPFTRSSPAGRVLRIPIAHSEGNYYAEEEVLHELEANHQVILRYCGPDGRISEEANPNGSINSIAGICNRQGNILGMMPHPERSVDPVLGNSDGRLIFESLLATLGGHSS